ncbi:MAG: HYR domain-containing protein [Thaumarchaeota archaeon]|nr:HYR domain-containing protein [Nitrososphaerota archaeon]
MSEILNGPDGNNVSYPIPAATDTIDPAPIVICTPAPDSLFPLGDTTVTCTATDASGNSLGLKVSRENPVVISDVMGLNHTITRIIIPTQFMPDFCDPYVLQNSAYLQVHEFSN